MDYISIDVVGTVASVPVRKGSDYFFSLRNERGTAVLDFNVFVRNDERPIDINKGDRVLITKAGLYRKKDANCLAVVEGSNVEVIRIRCNNGEKEV